MASFGKASILKDITGPIVRVSPTELHVSDPDFYDEIYAGSSHKRDKYTWYTDATPGVVAGTAPHDFHRARRSVLNPFFSRAGVKNLEPVIQQKVAHLCRRVDDYRRSGQAINVTMALHAFSMDVISSYCFDDCWDHLDYPDFNAAWFHAAETYTKSFKAFAYFKWLHQGLRSIPPRWIGKLVPMIDKFHYYEGVSPVFICRQIKKKTKKAKKDTCFYLENSQSLMAFDNSVSVAKSTAYSPRTYLKRPPSATNLSLKLPFSMTYETTRLCRHPRRRHNVSQRKVLCSW